MNLNINNKNLFFQELIKNQRKNLIVEKKLKLSDLKRIASYLSISIFENNCSIWHGYITEFKNNSYYINFYFNGKKHALHRLLYYNFIDDIEDNEYLKYNCIDKGKCCCIYHFTKNNLYKKNNLLKQFDKSKNNSENNSENNIENNSENNIKNNIENNIENKLLTISKYKKKIFVDL